MNRSRWGAAGFKVKAALENSPSLRDRLHDSPAERLEQLIKQARELVTDIVEFVKKRSLKQRVALLVDSLERLRGVTLKDADDIFYSVVEFFGWDNARLRFPGLHVVYSVPPYLALLANVRAFVSVTTLTSVRVFKLPQGKKRELHQDGLDAMQKLLDKRYSVWRDILSELAVQKLISSSGGDIRHFLRNLVATALRKAYYAPDRLPLQADDQLVRDLIDGARKETEQLVVEEEVPLLALIARTHEAKREKRDQLSTVARFFDIRVILNYRNGIEWFDAHPLLWPMLEDHAARSAPAADR